ATMGGLPGNFFVMTKMPARAPPSGRLSSTLPARSRSSTTPISNTIQPTFLGFLKVFIQHDADAVFGSRFAGAEVRRILMYRHQLANKFLTLLCNFVSNLNL